MDQPTIIIEQQKAPQILITPEGQLFQLLDNKGLLLLIPLETHENLFQPQGQHPSSQSREDGPLQYRQGRSEPGDLVLPEDYGTLPDEGYRGLGNEGETD